MAKTLGNFLILFFLVISYNAGAQVIDSLEDNLLVRFQQQSDVNDRLTFFFNTANRYNVNSAYDWLDQVNVYLNQAEKIQDSTSIRRYQLMQSQIYYDLGDYDKSVAIANDLYKIREGLDRQTKQLMFDIIDNNYGQLQLYGKQVEIRQQKRDLGFTKNITFYDIYSNLGLHRKAMEDYIMDMKRTIDDSDLFGLAKYNNQVGYYLLLDKSSSVALSNFKKGKGYIDVYLNDVTEVKTEKELQNAKILKGEIEGNIGKAYLQLKQFEEALPYLENSISIINENNGGQYSEEIVGNSLALADCHLQKGNYEKAKEILNSRLRPIKLENIVRKNRLLAAYYDKTKDYKRATSYLKQNVRINDSLNLNDSSLKKQQLSTVAKYEIENSKRMIDAQKLEMEQARNEMQAKDEQINLVFISLIFTLLGFAGLVYAYLKSIKTQRLIADQKHIIENSLVEKDSLLKEIHHRVKNNLQMVSSLLSLQTKNTRSKAAIAALEEGKSRVKAMALIHQKLYQNDDLSVIEMQGYIESLVNSVQSVFKKGGHNINITIDAESVELDIDRAIPFGLILNELVSNTFKYAFPEDKEDGKIYIHLRKNGEQGFFEYTDNGIGLSDDTDERVNSSMGIRLMNRLVNQLQSTLNIDKTTEGVRFWFNFK
ncbi:histidine kinase dimerization/phosphoacceptor domain -containing protein [Eudoraea chungangensis]|uniref:histidine kinase dimerization/phosphoacceptor domain -containing protein n=1 Tax=Eudoraea chungangensis TaxID=1481905 RepID=UPI0023EC0361|nr:histidine kinase dimerization/phosphoacceptor domain -containing protein [Eudoraea chungangensis]